MRSLYILPILCLLFFSCQKEVKNKEVQPVIAAAQSGSNAVTATTLKLFSTGYTVPVDITNASDSRLFVAQQDGKIFICDSAGKKRTTPFLDISDRVTFNDFDGLLSFCFDKNYKSNGFFYVYYMDSALHAVISRFKVSATNSNLANKKSELKILTINYVPNVQIGGCIKFGKDGNLYISTGDNSPGAGEGRYAQNHLSLMGKVLRINVKGATASTPYTIPADNPFAGNAGWAPEIYALGFRNPWRFSVDEVTGNVILGDVGEYQREEINNIVKGKNYGWPCYEGTLPFNTADCSSNYVAPRYEYDHSNGCCVIGGYVYRGAYSPMYGKYIYNDWCSGQFTALTFGTSGTVTATPLITGNRYALVGLGEDYKKELYSVDKPNNVVYKLTF